MKPLLSLFLVSCCLTNYGCGRRPGKLDGDVFIVTEDAQNVKLGLVEVRVLPYEETKNSIAKTRAQAEREVAKLQPQLDAARKAFASAEAKKEATDAEFNAHISTQSLDKHFAALMADIHATAELAPLEESVRGWKSGALYFASLPPPTASVKTDADGKFSIPLDRTAKVVLAANATRRLPDKTENYYWLVTVSLDGQPIKRIFLSNDNLATSGSKDSLVHVVE